MFEIERAGLTLDEVGSARQKLDVENEPPGKQDAVAAFEADAPPPKNGINCVLGLLGKVLPNPTLASPSDVWKGAVRPIVKGNTPHVLFSKSCMFNPGQNNGC